MHFCSHRNTISNAGRLDRLKLSSIEAELGTANMNRHSPNYKKGMERENGRKVLLAIANLGGVASYAELEKRSGVHGSTLNYNLDRLIALGLIDKEGRGTYRLVYKTPLCFAIGNKQPVAYFGLLGRKEKHEQPETQTALELLKKQSIEPELVYVVTSADAFNNWKNLKLSYQFLMCYEEEIIDIDAVKRKILPQLKNLLREYVVIMDCTSATKPASVAYYELANEFYIPLVYVYEDSKRLKWLISRETIRKSLGIS